MQPLDPPGKPRSPTQAFGFIDAIRGWAILAVVVLHSGLMVPGLPRSAVALLDQGNYGVQLFFIASALTLCLSMSRRQVVEQAPVRNFFIRRFFRIAPMFYIGIVLYAFTVTPPFVIRPSGGFPWWRYAMTAMFLHGYDLYALNGIVPGGWSIAAEMNFYLFFPLIFRYVTTLKRALWFCILAFIAGSGLSKLLKHELTIGISHPLGNLIPQLAFYWFPNQLCIFAMGIILFFVLKESLREGGLRTSGTLSSGISGPLLFLVLLLFGGMSQGHYDLMPHHFLYSTVLTLFAWALAFTGRGFFVNRLTIFLGKISYSIYITHFLILTIATGILTHLHGQGIHPPPLAAAAGVFVFVLASSAVVSSLTYRWIEQPGIALGKRLIDILERRSSIQHRVQSVVARDRPGLRRPESSSA